MKKNKIKIPSPVTKGCAKVPVVMQMEALECGAASLTMILAYYKKWVSLEQIIVLWIKEINTLKIEGKLAIIANSTYMWHVLRMPMEFYSQRMAGDIAQRQKLNESVAKELINSFAPLVLDAVMMVIYLVVMVNYSVLLALVGISSVIINLLVAGFISKKRINIMRVQMRNAGKLSGITVTGIEMIETIKASGAEDGTYDQLIEKGGVFAELVKRQRLDE